MGYSQTTTVTLVEYDGFQQSDDIILEDLAQYGPASTSGSTWIYNYYGWIGTPGDGSTLRITWEMRGTATVGGGYPRLRLYYEDENGVWQMIFSQSGNTTTTAWQPFTKNITLPDITNVRLRTQLASVVTDQAYQKNFRIRGRRVFVLKE